MNEKKSLKKEVLSTLGEEVQQELQTLIQDDNKRERFLRVLKTAIFQNPGLLGLHRGSLITACFKAAEWDMLPDNNEVALVPFKGTVKAIPMIGGFLKKLFSDPNFEKIYAEVIFEGDIFSYKIESEKEFVKYIPSISPGRNIIGAFAGIVYKNGKSKFEIARKHEVKRIIRINVERKGSSKAWIQYPEEMVKKYLIKRMAKRVLSLQVQDELLTSEDFEIHKETKHATVLDPQMLTGGKKEDEKLLQEKQEEAN